RYETLPLVGRKQQDIVHDPVDDPEHVQREVNPPSETDRMSKSRNAKPARNRHGIIFCSPENERWGTLAESGSFRNRMLKAEPFSAWRAIPVEIQTRMVRENLNSRTHDESHQEQVEYMVKAKPQRESFICTAERLARIARDKFLYGGQRAQLDSHPQCQNQRNESYGEQPQNIEPPLANSDSRGGPITRPRPLPHPHLLLSASYLCFQRISTYRGSSLHTEAPHSA